MEDLQVFEDIKIESYKGQYSVEFDDNQFDKVNKFTENGQHFLVDSRLCDHYGDKLKFIFENENCILIDASEKAKEVNNVLNIMQKLLDNGIKRNEILIAVGGGVVQDITCFITSVLFRGIRWKFLPTTLLSQADSCIGSKSSINLGNSKNILGTFNPPDEILICPSFLSSLPDHEVLSGVGEIIKVHIIDGQDSFEKVSNSYDQIVTDELKLLEYIKRALLIKKKYIEIDEFDKGIRNIFNYGHSFGHAIESATQFAIPHGIAVTIGMDMANRIAAWRNILPEDFYHKMHPVLKKNYKDYENVKIPVDKMIDAIKKDKKNIKDNLVLIMPVGDKANVEKIKVKPDSIFVDQCETFLNSLNT